MTGHPPTSETFVDALTAGLRRVHVGSEPIVVGVSGGADSVALLCGLVAIRDCGGPFPIVAHLDHGLRAKSPADAMWVTELAGRQDVAACVETVNVRGRAERERRGLEETARAARYEFLTRVAEREGAAAVAVAHTADDQAETILHHVIRGTGVNGLRGIARRRPLSESVSLVRPLLDIGRAEVLAYLDAIGQEFRVDDTNSDPAFTRNRIRHELLPLLERDFNPRVRDALQRLGRQADALSVFVEREATGLLERALRESTRGECRLDAAVLSSADNHLLRATLVELWRQRNWPRGAMGFDDWNRIVNVIRRGGAVSLPGRIDCRLRRGDVVFARPSAE